MAADKSKKLSLLNEELDEESATYIQESIENWKEGVMAQLQEEVERAKADKLEELEELNLRYREQLAEEYSDKLTTALAELKESVKADATASVLKNNPELKILEQIKDLVAPLLDENFRENSYSDTIAQLAEENAALRREQEITEGAQVLAELLAPYADTTQKLVLSMIKEGSPEEVTEQFYSIMESLQDVFGEAEDGDDNGDDGDDDDDAKKSKKNGDDDDDDENGDDDDDEDGEDDDLGESFLDEGFYGDDDDDVENDKDFSKIKNIMKSYIK